MKFMYTSLLHKYYYAMNNISKYEILNATIKHK